MISVILPTKNRVNAVVHAIQALDDAAGDLDVEVIIIDNGSIDNTESVVKAIRSENIEIIYCRQTEGGVSRAKNKGIDLSRGEVLVFTDDDCRVSIDYFNVLVAHYDNDIGPVIRGGRVELGDPDDAPITIKTEKEPALLTQGQHPGGFVHGCNLTMSRRVPRTIGMWDERFGPGAPFMAAEETEFNYRAHKAGIPVHYVPDLVSYHFHGRRDVASIKALLWIYEKANGALYAKHANFILTKHLYWYGRNWIKEWFGGHLFNKELNISHGILIGGQLVGIVMYYKTVTLENMYMFYRNVAIKLHFIK